MTLIALPSFMAMQEGQLLQGLLSGSVQFRAFARILAVEVLPTPFGPEKYRHVKFSLFVRNSVEFLRQHSVL